MRLLPFFPRVATAVAIALLGICWAQDVEPDRGVPPRLNLRGLTLDEAIQLALANNLGARVERLQQSIEDSRIVGRKSEFDPVFTLSGLYEGIEKPQNTREFVATQTAAAPRESRLFDEENLRFDTSLKGKTILGTEYEFTVELNSLKNTLNIDQPPSLFYPEYESFAGLRLTQPLLRDFGPEVQLAGLRVAQTDRRLAELSWKLKVMQVVATVMKNYYDLVFAADDTVIKAENIERARTLEDQNRTRVQQGVGSQLDVQQAAVAASVRAEELITAEYLQKEKANLLLRDLVADIDPVHVPVVRPAHRLSASAPSLDRADLMRAAVTNRIEYRQAQEQIGKQEIKLKFARNQLWPRLDLIGSLGANGLNSSGGSALGDAFESSHPAWSVGLMVTIPLGNRQAKAQLKEVETEKQQLLLSFKQLEIDLALQVDTAATRVETSQRRLATSRQSVAASQATLDAENKRLTQGVGVSFNILEAQRDLAGATSRELAARADLNKSIVDLWLSTGTLLSQLNIQLEEDPDAPVFVDNAVPPPAPPPTRHRNSDASGNSPAASTSAPTASSEVPDIDPIEAPFAPAEAAAEPPADATAEPAPGTSAEPPTEAPAESPSDEPTGR
ncbi:MAG: TolC family protein [Verrucomicrobiales bacterium]